MIAMHPAAHAIRPLTKISFFDVDGGPVLPQLSKGSCPFGPVKSLCISGVWRIPGRPRRKSDEIYTLDSGVVGRYCPLSSVAHRASHAGETFGAVLRTLFARTFDSGNGGRR
jgi:hypothetical protein